MTGGGDLDSRLVPGPEPILAVVPEPYPNAFHAPTLLPEAGDVGDEIEPNFDVEPTA